MNESKKKNIFTKKNIIIGVSILIVLLILVWFIFLREPKNKVMKCTMAINNYSYANISMSVDAYYTDQVNILKGKINFEITDATLKLKIDDLQKQLDNYYKKTVSADSIKINVYKENTNVVIDYDIDYNKVKDGDIESFDLFPVENNTKRITIDEFKEQILSSGGTCVEE